MAKPKSMSWMMGMPTIMPKVSRSRRSWRNSLIRMPSQREREKMAKRSMSLAPVLVLAALQEMDEGVLQGRRHGAHLEFAASQRGFQGRLQFRPIPAADVQGVPEACHQFGRRLLP